MRACTFWVVSTLIGTGCGADSERQNPDTANACHPASERSARWGVCATTDRLAFKSDKKGSKGQRNQWSHGPQDAEGTASHLPPPANPPNLGNKHVPVRGFYPVWLLSNPEPSPNSNTVSGPNNQLGQQFRHNTHKRRHKAQSTNNTVKIPTKHLKAWL